MDLSATHLQIILSDIFDSVCSTGLNKTDSLLEECHFDTHFLQNAVAPFELITGGMIGFVFWGVIIFGVYIKYQNGLLTMLVGLPVLFGSAIAFPSGFEMYITVGLAAVFATSIYITFWKVPRD